MESTIPLTRTAATVLCPLCGVHMEANPANMCPTCLRSQVNLQEEIAPSGPIIRCKECMRFQAKSKHWSRAELESPELLALVLKYLPGLHKSSSTSTDISTGANIGGGGGSGGGIEVVEAGWIWTEPHSKRLKVKLLVRKEILNGVRVQQRVEATYVIRTIQCEDCSLSYTEQTWKALVQVRQRVEHKRTFFFLEQLLLARGMQDKILDIQLTKDGMDFYFQEKHTAMQFVSFLQTVVPVRTKTSRKLISEDKTNNIHKNQHTMSVEIVPLCKDDLVLLLPKEKVMGGGMLQGFVLVSRVTSVIHLLNPTTLQHMEVPPSKYWRAPVEACLRAGKDLVQFEVLDVELLHGGSGGGGKGGGSSKQQHQKQGSHTHTHTPSKWQLAEVEVVKTSDFGVNDISYRVLTHLGAFLEAGDSVLGYDLKNSTSLGGRDDEIKGLRYDPPDIILVKKVDTDGQGKKERKRLKRLMARRQARAAAAAQAKQRERGWSAGSEGGEEEDEEGDRNFMDFAAELEQDAEMQALLEQHALEGGRKGGKGGEEGEEGSEGESESESEGEGSKGEEGEEEEGEDDDDAQSK